MSTFGLQESRLRELVTAVSGRAELGDEAVADRFARAAWSVIAEPGDGAAGTLIAEVGAAPALSLVLAASTGSSMAAPTNGEPTSATSATRPVSSTARHPAVSAGLERWSPRLRSRDVEHAFELAAHVGARLLVPARGSTSAVAEAVEGMRPGDSADPVDWPAGVDDLGVHTPAALWVRGDPERLRRTAGGLGIALVGARAATGYGEHIAGELAAGLVDRGHPIVSGAAYGIDGTAHRAALASGGLTIAFLAGGVDRFYPAGHDELLRHIVEHGLVLSELPCGAAPTKWRFLQRNRLIAAASAATVVVEAGARSGSLNTAGHAAALGRPLGAVPGPVTSPASAGCHRLLREYAAVCVTNAAEVSELAGAMMSPIGQDDSRDSPDVTRVLDAMSTRSARTAAQIAERAGLATSTVLAALGVLSLESRVREVAEGWVALGRRR